MQVWIERRVDRIRKRRQQERISISGSFNDALGCDIAARPRPVLHNKCLAEPTREPFPYEAGQNVGRATGGGADDQADPTSRVGLSPRESWGGGQSGSAYGQMQEPTARYPHGLSPAYGRIP